MRKEDYIRRIMTLYKHYEKNNGNGENVPGIPTDLKRWNWDELVEFAAERGLDNLEIQDLIRMADFAKEVLKEKAL